MQRVPPTWLWLVLIAFMATRLADAHLHLCFDGQEPPSTVHVSDGAVHNDAHHADETHDDRDVDVFDTALLKKNADPTDLVIIAFVAVLLLILPSSRDRFWPRSAYALIPVRSLLLLKPPLRGPPL